MPILRGKTLSEGLYTLAEEGKQSKTGHTLEFALPLPASTITNQQVYDKAEVRETTFKRREEGMSYRKSAKIVGCI
jgi:hypothetical protein